MPILGTGAALKEISRYRELNADLDQKVVDVLLPFYMAYRVPKEFLAMRFAVTSSTPYRHRAFFHANCMKLSGLSRFWLEFRDKRNSGILLQKCYKWLRAEATVEEWALLSRRHGYPRGGGKVMLSNTYRDTYGASKYKLWTGGGNWDRRSNFTKLIVLKEHLPPRAAPRPGEYGRFYYGKLGPDGILRLESEVMTVDPEKFLQPDAIREAMVHVRARLGAITGRPAGWRALVWFFDEKVQDERGNWWGSNWEGPWMLDRSGNQENRKKRGLPRKPVRFLIDW